MTVLDTLPIDDTEEFNQKKYDLLMKFSDTKGKNNNIKYYIIIYIFVALLSKDPTTIVGMQVLLALLAKFS